jgi:hypothetical protein
LRRQRAVIVWITTTNDWSVNAGITRQSRNAEARLHAEV